MKILSITAQKPHSTGSGTYMTELVNAWSRQGIDQAVVAGIYRNDDVCFPDGVDFYPVYFRNSQNDPASSQDYDLAFPIVGMSDVMPYESTLYRDLNDSMIAQFEEAFVKQITAAINTLNPDIIVCHHLFLLTAIVRKHFPDRIIYGICHGTCLRQAINCDQLRQTVEPEIRKLDHIYALHNEQAANIVEIFDDGNEHNHLSDKISIIGSGYNNHLFNADGRVEYQAGSTVRLCYAGKMSKPKGIPELLSALVKLDADSSVPPFAVTLAGGCQDTDVQEIIDALPACFNYLGQLPQTELAQVYKTNDIFILPSYFEGLNLATIEAMASGLLPICTNLPGMQDWINSNVDNPNVRYVSMPEMAGIDTPSDAGRNSFGRELEAVLRQAIIDIASHAPTTQPDTSKITWDSVAKKIVKNL